MTELLNFLKDNGFADILAFMLKVGIVGEIIFFILVFVIVIFILRNFFKD